MKKGLIILGLLFLIFPLVSAIDNNITLYTKSLVDVRLLVVDPGSAYYLFQSYPEYHTGFDGKMNILYSGDQSELGFSVIIKDDGKSVFNGRLDNQPAGGQINLYVLVNESDIVETVSDVSQEESLEELNNSVNNTNYTINDSLLSPENVEVSNSSKKSFLTGLSISPIKDVFTKNKNYLLGGIVFILLVFLAMIIVLKRGKIRLGKGESFSDNRPPTILYDKKIEDAERRIKQAQQEIQDLRNSRNKPNEVTEARKKYEEAKRNLDRLEKTGSFNQDIKPSFQQDSNNFRSGNSNNSQTGNSNKPDVKDFDFGNSK